MNDRHQIIKKLGSGGFGTVYQARDTHLERDIAIKRLNVEDYANQRELKDQLLSEAKILAGLKHPNIVSIFDVVETETGGDIIMELIEGDTLDQVVKKHGPFSVDQFLFIATQLLSALAATHELGILHCDLKPSNLMMTLLPNGSYQVSVLDFGLSPSQDGSTSSSSKNQGLLGSIHFMAPEVIETNVHTEATDIYAIGCIFYYMLTGQYPFEGDSPVIIMASHMRNDFTPLLQINPDFPDALCEWIESHIQLKDSQRVESCRESLNLLMHLEGVTPIENLPGIAADGSIDKSVIDSLANVSKSDIILSAKQQAEFEKHKKSVPSAVAQATPLAERVHQARPQDLWYFSIDDVRKGPVPFTKICELIASGYIRSNDPIYQHRIGEWTPAIQIPEFKEEFEAASMMPPRPVKPKKVSLRNSQRIRAQREAAKAAQAAIARVAEEDDEDFSFPVEITATLALVILSVVLLFVTPSLWQACLVINSILLITIALITIRVKMNQYDPRWLVPAILLPILSDLFFTIIRPKQGLQSLFMLVLGSLFFLYASQHRYSGDFLHAWHLGFLSQWLG